MDVQIILTTEAINEIRNRNRLAHGYTFTEQHYGPTFTGPLFRDVVDSDLYEGFFSVSVADHNGKPALYHYNTRDIRRIKEYNLDK
jgi:hypothetical protein